MTHLRFWDFSFFLLWKGELFSKFLCICKSKAFNPIVQLMRNIEKAIVKEIAYISLPLPIWSRTLILFNFGYGQVVKMPCELTRRFLSAPILLWRLKEGVWVLIRLIMSKKCPIVWVETLNIQNLFTLYNKSLKFASWPILS